MGEEVSSVWMALKGRTPLLPAQMAVEYEKS